MATLGAPQLQEARTYVNNYLTSGNIKTQGSAQPRHPTQLGEFINDWNSLFDQVVQAHGGNTGTYTDRMAHIHTGTGGVLIALLEMTAEPLRSDLTNKINTNQPLIAGQAGSVISKSGCTTHDVSEFAARRGLWAGWQG